MKTCLQCGRGFTALRAAARYCEPACRWLAAQTRKRGRREALERSSYRCAECGTVPRTSTDIAGRNGERKLTLDKLFVRDHPSLGRVALCGKCNSALSRAKFRARVPDAGRNYANKLYASRQAEIEATEIVKKV